MAKSINLKLALKDQFSAPLKKATGSTKKIDKQLKKATRSIKRFGNTAKKSMKKAAKVTAVGATAIAGSLGVFAKKSIDAAKVQIEQETKLQAVLMNTKGMRKDQIEGIKKYAGELQQVGVIGDEVALAGVQQLGSYQLQAETLKKLMPGMNDLLVQQKGLNAATGDAVNIGNMIGKVMTGQVGALSRAGINFSKTQEKILKFGTEEEKAAVLADVLTQNVGGVNKAMAETDQGKIQQMNNNLGDVTEEVGKKLLPNLAKLASWWNSKIPMLQDILLKAMDKIAEALGKLKPYIEQAKEMLGKMFDDVKPAIKVFGSLLGKHLKSVGKVVGFLVKNFDRLSPIIYTVVGAMTAYKAIMFGTSVVTTAVAVATKLKASWDLFGAAKLNLLTLAQWGYNAALTANPIGLVIAGVAALTAGVWLAYKNFDAIKKKVLDFWKALDNTKIGTAVKVVLTALTTPLRFMFNLFSKLTPVIANVWETIKGEFIPMLEKLLSPVDAAKKAISGLIDKFKFWNKSKPKNKTVEVKIEEQTIQTTKKVKDKINKPNKANVTKVVSDAGNTNSKTSIPRHALGTSYFQGGATSINEGGRAEKAILPSGTQIVSHEQLKREDNSNKVEVVINIQGNVIGNKQFMEKVGNFVGTKVLTALKDM